MRPFDVEQHHVGLGPADDSLLGFLLTGGYDLRLQEFGAPTEFGSGDDLTGAPSLSRWNQDDFTGGIYQQTWGHDPKMIADSLNVVPAQFDRSLRTCPPLFQWHAENIAGRIPIYTFAYGNCLYAVFTDRVRAIRVPDKFRFDYVPPKNFANDTEINCAHFDRNTATLYLGTYREESPGLWSHLVRAIKPSITQPPAAATFTVDSNKGDWSITTGDDWDVRLFGFHTTAPGPHLVATGTALYLCEKKPGVISPTQTRIGRLPGPWKGAVSHDGMTYILCGDLAVRRGQVVAFDGQKLLPVCEFPYNFTPETIEAYGGRVYVGGSGNDINDVARYGELYEITGASLRLVRTFAPQARSNGLSPSRPKSIRSLGVYEGLLYFGDTGRCLVGYDVQNDAFFGGPLLAEPNGVSEVRGIVSRGEVLYAYVVHPLNQAADGWQRIAQNGDLAAGYDGKVVTSDFAAEPGRQKRWSKVVVMTRNGGCVLDYSLDSGFPGGDTFVSGLPSTQVVRGGATFTTFDLSGVPISEQIRFRIKMLMGVNVTSYTELVAFSCSFAFLDSGKWSWGFTINGAEAVERDDRSTEKQDVKALEGQLRQWARQKTPLRYRDLDGSTYNVQIVSFSGTRPVVGPRIIDGDDFGREAFYHLTLLEV